MHGGPYFHQCLAFPQEFPLKYEGSGLNYAVIWTFPVAARAIRGVSDYGGFVEPSGDTDSFTLTTGDRKIIPFQIREEVVDIFVKKSPLYLMFLQIAGKL